VLVALALTVAALATVVGRIGDDNEFRDIDFLGTVLVLLQTLPLAVRRVAPLGVLVVINEAVVICAAMGYEMVQAGTFSSLVALYGAASLTGNRRGILAAAITVAALATFFATTRDDFSSVDIFVTSGTWAMGWFLGTYLRVRGEQAEAAGELAARLPQPHRDPGSRSAACFRVQAAGRSQFARLHRVSRASSRAGRLTR